jgi:hypothetical protein
MLLQIHQKCPLFPRETDLPQAPRRRDHSAGPNSSILKQLCLTFPHTDISLPMKKGSGPQKPVDQQRVKPKTTLL